METSKKQILLTDNAPATEALAEKIGGRLKGGECIELISDLGGGKTTFTRGLAHGAGSTDNVASPTFTVSRVYHGPNFDIHHFDFYRLQEAGLAAHELHELLDDPKVVIVVEWGGLVEQVLPADRLTIRITSRSETERRFELQYPENLAYLVNNL